jgi:hypothetical protein
MTHLMREITLFCPKILKKTCENTGDLNEFNSQPSERNSPSPFAEPKKHYLQRENDFLNPKNQEKN